MSRKGGYKIIDLKGLDFSSNKVIDGIYESIKDNYGKPLLFSGIVIDGVEKDDVFANVEVNGDGYDVTLYDQTLHINDLDIITLPYKNIQFSQDFGGFEVMLNRGIYVISYYYAPDGSSNTTTINVNSYDETSHSTIICYDGDENEMIGMLETTEEGIFIKQLNEITPIITSNDRINIVRIA